MEAIRPMSHKVRRRMVAVSVILFILAVPTIVLYASGYRFSFTNSKVVSTGGIFVSMSPSGSAFSVDGRYVQSTGLFSNSFFEQDLTPGMHDLSVSKDGFEPWSKKISVKPNEVSEVNSLLIPSSIIWKRVVLGTTTSTTSVAVSAGELAAIRSLFTGTSTDRYVFPISTTTARASGGISLWSEKNVVVIERRSSNIQMPGVFCVGGISTCVSRVFMPLNGTPSFLDFYPDRSDAAVVAYGASVFAIEMDNHSPRLMRTLYTGIQPTVRVSKGVIYIKDQDKILMTDQLRG